MNKKLFFIAIFAFMHLWSKASSRKDSTDKVNKTQIDIVYNNYLQEGNNSAITGGIGTEKLMVYSPSIGIKSNLQNHSLLFKAGADIISSASTDKIDYIMSSASVLDTRSYANASYKYTFEKQELSLYGGIGFSIESDYFSIGSKIGIQKKHSKTLSEYSAEFQMFNDDLRWGRLSVGSWKPQKLIYPVELRYKEWYNVYRRNSFNLKLGYSKAINKRAILGIYPVLSYQTGLLSTPFHRIYFEDGTQAVEKLPEKRFKASLGLKWNQFVGGRFILKNTINPFVDDWGILSLSIQNETAIKINQIWTILPNFRFQMQKGTNYFAPYKKHQSNAKYYTSDYDLATNQTYNAGLGLKFTPYYKIGKNSHFNALMIRYNFMYRANGLTAHIISMNIQFESKTKGRK